ncbi:MAG: PilN domain-containing protein [Metallibacterium scheffleri]|jgi:type IV pilus assembly protein PilN|uniref:PilN domain-containing protein n=1 Tax=Metallibacterium scheffleri TaxID=993689 RepID=UPI0026F298DB|nr:PilN domain-containing protein [Metallibacterium scheffleri]MCK9366113.1 PilN domain-containing protein [Metallibacterium scheffleri]
MARINLLPWRAERRKQREREFFMQLGAAAAVALVLVIGWSMWMGMRIDNQTDRNAYLQGQITQLKAENEQIKNLDKVRDRLLARKKIIEDLQANRSQMVHLFDELVKRTPPSVRLTSMAQKGEQLTLEGVAQSNAAVADYMRNLEASPWLGAADLQKTEKKAGDSRMPYDFGLTVKLGMPKNAGVAAATSSLASLPIPVVPGAPAGADTAKSPAHAAISAPPAAAASHAGSIKPGAQP